MYADHVPYSYTTNTENLEDLNTKAGDRNMGTYYCSKCQSRHRDGSAIGKSHEGFMIDESFTPTHTLTHTAFALKSIFSIEISTETQELIVVHEVGIDGEDS